MRSDLTFFSRSRREIRELLYLAGPIIIAQLSTHAVGFVDAAMAGRYSAADLAAIAIGSGVWGPLLLLIRGIMLAITPSVAHLYGAQRYTEIGPLVRQGLWLALLVSLIGILLLGQADSVLTWMDVSPELIPLTSDYLDAIAWGIPALALTQVLISYNDAIGKTKPTMLISIAGLLLNIPANYIFIYGKFGFPAMGGVGCGWSSAVVFWFMFLLMLLWTVHGRIHQPMKLYERFEMPQLDAFRSLTKLGLPIGLTLFVESSIFCVISLLIGKLGAQTVAGHQITLNFSGMSFMIPLSISMAVTVRVGQALGAGDSQQARFASGCGVATAVAASVLAAILMVTAPEFIARIYSNDPEVISLAASLMLFAAMFQISDGLQGSAAGALRGYKDTRWPMILVVISYWVVGLPIGYILGLGTETITPQGPAGFWIGLVAGLTCAAALLGTRLIVVSRKAMSPKASLQEVPRTV
ncbi:MATE family efflux transporter [Spongorhabdus nitratireducens]